MVTPDGAIVFFASGKDLYAAKTADATSPWDAFSYTHPSGSIITPILADFSLSRYGEFLYYCRGGGSIAMLRVADLVDTPAPAEAASKKPTVSPTVSAVPSASVVPSVSNVPSESREPSAVPTRVPTLSPTGGTLRPTRLPTPAPVVVNVVANAEAPDDGDDGLGIGANNDRLPTYFNL